MTPADDAGTDVMAQADALMRRHRVFLAGGSSPTPAHANPDPATVPREDDLPVLTDVVALEDTTGFALKNAVDHSLALRQEQLAEALTQWLDEELPQAVLRVMDGFSDKLIAELVTRAQTELLPRLLESTYHPDEK